MESTVEVSMDDTVTVPSVAEEEAIGSLSCDADSVSFADQQCDLKGDQVQLADDGEVLLVEDLHDFQTAVSSDAVVVDDGQSGTSRSSPYQQYQSVVVQGYVTSSGEIVHVVQQDATTGGTSLRSLPSQPQAQSYQQPPTMHPDLYRLVKMFPDFSTKTLHRIFLMCHCDLKRALDQALFARQFRQLDASPSYAPVAPSSAALSAGHYHAAPSAPYRTPARPSYMQQLNFDLGADLYLPRGGRGPGMAAATPGTPLPSAPSGPSAPILVYHQADPRLSKGARAQATHHAPASAQQLADADLRCAAAIPVSLGDGLGFSSFSLLTDSGLGGPGSLVSDADELDPGPGAGGDAGLYSKRRDKVSTPSSTESDLPASAQ